ncbi:hypothetical protein E2C01_092576 [Portunus trituberculatus]|uniref:Uncharacterized protein n=1 Tax=Portunus trituberculatus TaxID=210409 RepID=A0A5B7JGT5_PORTR|nr:hypothetical protein [Portunus trituberculatus]
MCPHSHSSSGSRCRLLLFHLILQKYEKRVMVQTPETLHLPRCGESPCRGGGAFTVVGSTTFSDGSSVVGKFGDCRLGGPSAPYSSPYECHVDELINIFPLYSTFFFLTNQSVYTSICFLNLLLTERRSLGCFCLTEPLSYIISRVPEWGLSKLKFVHCLNI